ncbi:MAG: PEP-CTERM sorting domain-containing protein [Candidatus Tectimicrobiota bacterium]
MKRLFMLLVPGLLLAFASSVCATTLMVDPLAQTKLLGQQATVTIESSNSYIGDFDLNIMWDTTILALSAITYGTHLGGGLPDSLQNSFVFGGGTVNASEISLLSATDLIALQPSQTATLLSLVFDTIALGTSPVIIGVIQIGDENGELVIPDLHHGSITVIQRGTTDVPEPSSIVLLASGIGLLVWRLRRT